jgi:hypothetical protein
MTGYSWWGGYYCLVCQRNNRVKECCDRVDEE